MWLTCRNPATKTPKSIYQVDTDEVGIGGKGSGQAAIIQRDGSVEVPQDIATKVTQVKVEAVARLLTAQDEKVLRCAKRSFRLYQEPVFGMLVQGSAGGSAPPACRRPDRTSSPCS